MNIKPMFGLVARLAAPLGALLAAACDENEMEELKGACFNDAVEVWRAEASCQKYYEMSCEDAVGTVESSSNCQVSRASQFDPRETCYAEFIFPSQAMGLDDWRSLVRSGRCDLNIYWQVLANDQLLACQARAVVMAPEGKVLCVTPEGMNRNSDHCQPIAGLCE